MKTVKETRGFSQTCLALRFAVMACCFLALFYFATTDALCQGHPGAPNPDEAFAKLKERLNLTDEQATQVRPIIEQKFAKQKEIFQQYQGKTKEERQPMWGELQEVQKNTQEQLSGILTKEQMEEYMTMREEKKEQMRQRGQKMKQQHHGMGVTMPSGTGADPAQSGE